MTAKEPAAQTSAGSIANRIGIEGPLTVRSLVELLREYVIVFAVLLLALILTFSSDVFLTSTNILNVLEQAAPVGIIAVALTFVLISGEFDISAGAIVSFTGVLAAKIALSMGTVEAFVLAILAATAIGVINGFLVSYLRINSFVCTLATGLIVAGFALVITQGFLLTVPDRSFAELGTAELFGIKYSIWLFAVVVVSFGFVLHRTKFGRWLYAVGGNVEAARLSGIHTRLVKLAALGLSGFAAGLAGAILASRTSQGQADDGISLVLYAFAAVVVGGTSVQGGRGAVWRTVMGLLLLALIGNGFNLLSVDPIYQQIVQGGIILAAVAADSLSRRQTAA